MTFWVKYFENGQAGRGHRKNKADYEQEKSSKGKKVEETMCESLGKVNSTRKLTEVTGVLAGAFQAPALKSLSHLHCGYCSVLRFVALPGSSSKWEEEQC